MTKLTGDGPLTQRVRGLLRAVLNQATFRGYDELLQQVSSVVVTGGSVTMLELDAMGSIQASGFTDGLAPIRAVVVDVLEVPVGELLIWVEGGYIKNLEYAWWTDVAPKQLPRPEHVQVASAPIT